VWLPEQGPAVVLVRSGAVHDISAHVATVSALLEVADPVAYLRSLPLAEPLIGLPALLGNSDPALRNPHQPWLLAPIDLQAVKAAGVTFATSLLERVVEEQAKGDPAKADAIRDTLASRIGADLSQIVPGSAQAEALRKVLVEQGLWSQYLEVGIGPDAEVFTKAQPLSAVGHGADIGIHPKSSWNNPEPEVVLAVSSDGCIKGAMLGNDVNLRDFEGRSALLLSKAKDNNASTALARCCACSTKASAWTMCAPPRWSCRWWVKTASSSPAAVPCARSAATRRTWCSKPSTRTISTPTAWCCSSVPCSPPNRTATNRATASPTSRAM
jgi:fumarylacetoacetate (FAA) hydrolase family protein